MLLMMLLTLNLEDNEMIPRIMTGDLRKPQLDWLMLRKIPQVQERLKVQWEGMLEVVSTHEVYQSNDNDRDMGDIEY